MKNTAVLKFSLLLLAVFCSSSYAKTVAQCLVPCSLVDCAPPTAVCKPGENPRSDPCGCCDTCIKQTDPNCNGGCAAVSCLPVRRCSSYESPKVQDKCGCCYSCYS